MNSSPSLQPSPDAAGGNGRFAPSPTGTLHAGSLLAAFGSWLFARHRGAGWQVRVEDVDPPRTVAGAAQGQLATLLRFGLSADGPVLQQSHRDAVYQQALDRLLAQGNAFVCHCSRSDLAASGGLHHRCVARAPRPDPAVRLRVPPGSVVRFNDRVRGPQVQDVHAEVGDVVLRRADGCWAYQLAVVVDDHAQGVDEVVRGADLLGSTARQILLQRALGLPTPTYAHLPLLLDAQGRKLSKSLASAPVAHWPVMSTLGALWQLLGQPAQAWPLDKNMGTALRAAAAAFVPSRVPAHDLAYEGSALQAMLLQNPPSPT